MKKRLLYVIILVMLLCTGCSSTYKQEKCIKEYLNLVKEENWEQIWNNLPLWVKEYKLDKDGNPQKENLLIHYSYMKDTIYKYIETSTSEVEWIRDLYPQMHSSFNVEVYEVMDADINFYSDEYRSIINRDPHLMEAQLIKAYVSGDDGKKFDAKVFMVKNGNDWQMVSVVGTDAIYESNWVREYE